MACYGGLVPQIRRYADVCLELQQRKAAAAVDIGMLQQAARFVSEVGDAQNAIEAIRQLRSLQIQ